MKNEMMDEVTARCVCTGLGRRKGVTVDTRSKYPDVGHHVGPSLAGLSRDFLRCSVDAICNMIFSPALLLTSMRPLACLVLPCQT
jgi:hypothetical protein